MGDVKGSWCQQELCLADHDNGSQEPKAFSPMSFQCSLTAWAGGSGHPFHTSICVHEQCVCVWGKKLRGLLSLQHQSEECLGLVC